VVISYAAAIVIHRHRQQCRATVAGERRRAIRRASQFPEEPMADEKKLSVEKALNKLREDKPKSKTEQRDEKTEKLNEEIKRMRAQRLRLDR
jgi:hypothetical protein